MTSQKIHYVLGAPGAGKSTLVHHLQAAAPEWIVLDWDALMDPASTLAGKPIRDHESLWPSYEDLVHTMIQALNPHPVCLLSVCTPDQLADWPQGPWTLLDCADTVRRQRLQQRGENTEMIHGAIDDAGKYRSLWLPRIDTSTLTPQHVAEMLTADMLRSP